MFKIITKIIIMLLNLFFMILIYIAHICNILYPKIITQGLTYFILRILYVIFDGSLFNKLNNKDHYSIDILVTYINIF